MTYDDWKTTEPESLYDPPQRCEKCWHRDGDCDCPCCVEPLEREAALLKLSASLRCTRCYCHPDECLCATVLA